MSNYSDDTQRVIDPEVLPPRSHRHKRRLRKPPKWVVLGTFGAASLLAVSTAKTFLPLLCFGLVAGLALTNARNP